MTRETGNHVEGAPPYQEEHHIGNWRWRLELKPWYSAVGTATDVIFIFKNLMRLSSMFLNGASEYSHFRKHLTNTANPVTLIFISKQLPLMLPP
jgi:hypothetical protein